MNTELLTKFYELFAQTHKVEFKKFLAENEHQRVLELQQLRDLLGTTYGDVVITEPQIVNSIPLPHSEHHDPYPIVGSWADKIKYSIDQIGKPSATADIAKFISKKEPDKDFEKIKIGVQVTISRHKGKLFSSVKKGGEHLYFMKDAKAETAAKSTVEVRVKDGYNPEMTWTDKIKIFIGLNGGKATSGQLFKLFDEYEYYANKEVRDAKHSTLSAVIRNSLNAGKHFEKSTAEGKTFFVVQ